MNRKPFIEEILIGLFVLAQIVSHLIDFSDVTMNLVRGVPGLLCLLYYLFNGKKEYKKTGLLVAVFFSFTMGLSMIYNHNARPINILWIWSYMGVALMLYEFGLRIIVAKILFYVVSLFYVYYALTGKISAADLLYGTSANGVSEMCVLVLFIYCSSIIKSGGWKIPYVPILIVLFLSIWTATRSAMLTMGLFLLFAFIHNSVNLGFSFRQIFIILIIVLSGYYFYTNYFSFYGAGLIEKMDRYGMESLRTEIWSEYLMGIRDSFYNLLFGVPCSDAKYFWFHHYNGNAHNAFFVLHSKYGILGFAFVLLAVIKTVFKSIKGKDFFLLILLLVVIIRSFFDWTAFPGSFDAIFYFYFIYVSDRANKNYYSVSSSTYLRKENRI